MDIVKAVAVRSTAGRDAGGVFIVLDVEGEYAWLVNGRSRRMEKPKKKKLRHIKFFHENIDTAAGRKLRSGEKPTNAEIRKAIEAAVESKTGLPDEGGVMDA